MSISTSSPLARNDAAVLSAAASQPHDRIVLAETMTPLAGKRLIGRLLKRGLVAPPEAAGEAAHALTPAGYETIGMTLPAPPIPTVADDAAAPQVVRKRELVLGLLGRTEGATVVELIAATGWLAHTTRAALSRMRSAGQVLEKTRRADGATAYRIVLESPTPRQRPARGSARRKVTLPQGATA